MHNHMYLLYEDTIFIPLLVFNVGIATAFSIYLSAIIAYKIYNYKGKDYYASVCTYINRKHLNCRNQVIIMEISMINNESFYQYNKKVYI